MQQHEENIEMKKIDNEKKGKMEDEDRSGDRNEDSDEVEDSNGIGDESKTEVMKMKRDIKTKS